MKLEKIDRFFTSDQPTLQDFETISHDGFEMVINLAMKNAKALANEEQIVKDLGMKYVNIEVDFENPTIENFENFVKIYEDNKHKKIIIHCIKNMRVSVFIYLYRIIFEKVDKKEALKEVEKIWQPNAIWLLFMTKIYNYYKGIS